MPKGKSMNCKAGDDIENFFLHDDTCNKPIASHPGWVHTPKHVLIK